LSRPVWLPSAGGCCLIGVALGIILAAGIALGLLLTLYTVHS
jgi:hypothetical protein